MGWKEFTIGYVITKASEWVTERMRKAEANRAEGASWQEAGPTSTQTVLEVREDSSNPFAALEGMLQRLIDHLQRRTNESTSKATQELRAELEAAWPDLVRQVEEATARAADASAERAAARFSTSLQEHITRIDSLATTHREQFERQLLRVVIAASALGLMVGGALIVLAYVLFR